MKILALIPARGGSKGIPKKNIIDLGGYPLIAYTIAAAKLSKNINRIIVSTDSEEIANISKKYGAEVPFLRPSEISQDNSTDIEFINHALDFLEKNEGYVPDLIIHLRPITPLRNPEDIDRAIEELLKDKEATALRSAHIFNQPGYKLTKIKDGYWEFFGKEDFPEGFEYYNLPRQQLPKTYFQNGYVDIIIPKTIKTLGSLHGKKIKSFITEVTADIDDYNDLRFAEKLLNEQLNIMVKNKLKELVNGKIS
ncbi:MAG: acylneuraminate cytidylyltransferase family protein [Candidatus Pacearchaeota archaeon]|jgi:CMP-N-acetylneuraminic acid synthetase